MPADDRSAGVAGGGEMESLSPWSEILRLQCAQPSAKLLVKMQILRPISRNWLNWSQKVSRVTQGIQMLEVQGSRLVKVIFQQRIKWRIQLCPQWHGRECVWYWWTVKAQARGYAGSGWGFCSELDSRGRRSCRARGDSLIFNRVIAAFALVTNDQVVLSQPFSLSKPQFCWSAILGLYYPKILSLLRFFFLLI